MNNKLFKLSASKLSTYKSCPKKYWYSYIMGLIPEKKPEALQIGTDYHAEVERYLKGEITSSDNYLVQAFIENIDVSGWEILETEKSFNESIGHGLYNNGIVDGIIRIDGKKYLLEHKTTSEKVNETYEYNLKWDDQIPIYCGATGIYNVMYTAIYKNKLKQGGKETDEDYFRRRVDWYKDGTENKIRCFVIRRLESEVGDCRKELSAMAKRIRSEKIFYRNKMACRFGCPHKEYCLNYIPGSIPVGMKKKESK